MVKRFVLATVLTLVGTTFQPLSALVAERQAVLRPAGVISADAELWTVVLEHAVGSSSRSAYILLDQTVASAQFQGYLPTTTPDAVLFEQLVQRNQTAAAVAGVQLPSNTRLVDATLVLLAAVGGQASSVDFVALAKKFPGTMLIQLSRPAFSQDGTRALMYYWATGGFDDSWGGCSTFEKREGRWILVESPCGWIT